jgi:dienelactone hydrolase
MSNRRLSRILLVAAALMLPLGACAGRGGSLAESNLSDIELTWMRAVVALPPGVEGGDVSLRRMADVLAKPPQVNRPLPTVVYLHGCTGLGDLSILKTLAQAGYAVIAPDSMARRYRPLQCDPATGRGGFNLFVYDFRQTELTFAVHNIPRLPWVDGTNLFLLGGSEGGVAAALYRGDAFHGRIITAWTCHGAPIVAGLASSPMEPVLSIVSVDDPWYAEGAAVGQTGDCGAYMAGRPNARSIVLPAGEGHAVLSSHITRQAILEFLASWSRN